MLADHKAIENVHNDHGQACFQLKECLRHAQLAHPDDALPVDVSNVSELVEDDNAEEHFGFNGQGQPIPVQEHMTCQKLHAQFGCKQTHNKQLIVALYGIIIACETFYHAEAIYSVVVCFRHFKPVN